MSDLMFNALRDVKDLAEDYAGGVVPWDRWRQLDLRPIRALILNREYLFLSRNLSLRVGKSAQDALAAYNKEALKRKEESWDRKPKFVKEREA